jgi:hypothetical protein
MKTIILTLVLTVSATTAWSLAAYREADLCRAYGAGTITIFDPTACIYGIDGPEGTANL